MNPAIIVLIVLCLLAIIFIAVIYGIYLYAFAADKRRERKPTEVFGGEQYEPYAKGIVDNIERILRIPGEKVNCTSHDGLRLVGHYYHFADNAPVAIFFNGYRGSCYFDGSGGFCICEECGVNILLVDQRGHGESQGRTITFGVKERYDCLSWINYIIDRFGRDTEIMLMGISMGAATVLMASGLDLPENVKGIAADCGYSSPKEILCSVSEQMKLPSKLTYPLMRLAAKWFGGFDPEESSAAQAVRNCRVPVLIIHGDDDRFVPCWMSNVIYDACASEKELVIVPKAGHGLSFSLNERGYRSLMFKFVKKLFGEKTWEEKSMDIKNLKGRSVVLFDLDGTLLPMNNKGFEKMYFSGLCKAFPEFEPDALVAGIWAGTKAMVLNDGSVTNREAFAKVFSEKMGIDYYANEEHFTQFYRTDFEKCVEQCVVTERSGQIIETLRSKGYTVAVATNPIFPQVGTYARLRWLGLDAEQLPLVTTFENSHFAKPNPKYYEEICGKLGVKPEDCVMIGNDVAEDGAAKQLGMEVVIVSECIIHSNGLPTDEFYVVPTLDDILSWAKALPKVK